MSLSFFIFKGSEWAEGRVGRKKRKKGKKTREKRNKKRERELHTEFLSYPH